MRPLLALVAVWLLAAGSLAAEDGEPPRTPDGRPLLEGVWTNASLTRLTRPEGQPLVLSPAEAEELAGGHFHNVRAAADLEKSDPDRQPEAVERLPPVGNYNAFWVDPGSTYAVVDGEIRSSWIVEPEDGQIPLLPEARERQQRDRRIRAGLDGPEALSLGERCLIGFGGTGGPPMLNVLYNNFYRIVQTPDHVMILVEMVHDARIVRLGGEHGPVEHGPAETRRWLGDSIGRWEGDTLVIETRHFHPARAEDGALPYSAEAVVVERISRGADDRLHYAFEITDPRTYSRPIRGEMSFVAAPERVWEYACHEGNYAMGGILRGARLAEQTAEETAGQPAEQPAEPNP